MNQAALLYRLQKIDTQLDQINARLVEIERLLNEDERVRAAKKVAEEAKMNLEKKRQALREIEHFGAEQQVKIEQAESSLYSGRIQNPKELQDLQKDITSLKKHLSTIEDQELQAMIDLETAEKQESDATLAYHQAQAEAIQNKAGFAGEKEQLNKTRQRLNAERAVALTPIAPQSLEIYNRVREQKKGVAVTSLEDDSCALCGAQIRLSEGQAARLQSNLLYCSSCGRILYAG